ncbi:hypothetical protein IFM89_012378 [Coptis chinensis]|uniref:TF-B3 domain-containing protein n=1 Tax=Coptis chinensis TaxID=261450 RepID=A0A835HHI7_9MAGN|nr:hypothetical protein IFM89_012378 [Coptis chinensis]
MRKATKSSEEESSTSSYEDSMTLAQHFQLTTSRRRSWPTEPKIRTYKVVSDLTVTSSSSECDKVPLYLDKAKLCAKEQAEEQLANLDPNFPSFVKAMARSNVMGKMGIPEELGRSHLPKEDAMFILVDENQKEYITKYLCHVKNPSELSSGWGHFSKAHKLVEGDHLVFQLVNNTTFQVMFRQVYIIRAYGPGAIDLTVNSPPKHTSIRKNIRTSEKIEKKPRKNVSLAVLQPPTLDSITDSEKVGSVLLEDFVILEQVVPVRLETSSSFEQERAPVVLDKAKLCARERAEELIANLDPLFPSFVKAMTRCSATNDRMVYIIRAYGLGALTPTVGTHPEHATICTSLGTSFQLSP